MAAPTAEELVVVEKFRRNLTDLNLQGFFNTDMGLLQWLRARDLHVGKAEEMLRKSMKWRQEKEIDSILSWKPPSELLEICPMEFGGYDNDNCPIAFMQYGRWDIRKVFNLGYRDDYIKYSAQVFEMMREKMKGRVMPSGQPVTQFVFIGDMEGLSMRTLASFGAISMSMEATHSFEENYPETMKKIYATNASRVFAAFYALVKPILSQRTTEKLQIFDSRVEIYKKALLQNIREDQLPPKLVQTWANSSSSGPRSSRREGNEKLEGHILVTITPGGKLPVEVEVKERKSILRWSFVTQNYDVGFSLTCGTQILVPYSKVNSHWEAEEGALVCEEVGTHSLIFDNSYSRFREKVLHYKINVLSPCDGID